MEQVLSETCQQLIAQLSSFLDGDLDPALCEKIELHLATCPVCPVVVDTTKKTIALYHDAPLPPLPPTVRQHLIAALGLENQTHLQK
jgi:anti-sigma factor RsiW